MSAISDNAPERWAEKARNNVMWPKPQDKEAIEVIEQLMQGKIGPQTAAESLASAYNPALKRGEKNIDALWESFCDAFCTLGDSIEKGSRFVEVIKRLSKLPDLVDDHGQLVQSSWGNKETFWVDLPEFALNFRELMMGM